MALSGEHARSSDGSRAEAEVASALNDLRAVTTAVRRVAGLLDYSVLATRASREIQRLSGLDMASIALIDHPDMLVMMGAAGARTVEWSTLRFHFLPGVGVAGSAITRREPVSLDDYQRFNRPDEVPSFSRDREVAHGVPLTDEARMVRRTVVAEGIRGFLAAPIQFDGQVLGILYAATRSIGPLENRAQERVIQFADQVAPSLASARQAQDATLLRLQQERERIAFSLHETIGQILFGIEALAQRAQLGLPTGAAALGADLHRIEAEASRAASHLREALHAMGPSALDTTLATEIRMSASVFTNRTGVPVDVVVIGNSTEVSSQAYAVLLTGFREALHNIEKHARAQSVVATVHFAHDCVEVIVQDDGVGLFPDFALKTLSQHGHHLGLSTLQRGLEQLGGSLELISNEDGGMTLRASLPGLAAYNHGPA